MKSRGMVGLVAFLLAGVATMAVFLYVHGVKQNVETKTAEISVIVSKADIPAGSRMDSLIDSGSFTSQSIPRTAVVDGAVTSLQQLRGRVTSVPILAGEQIPAARLQGSTELPGGAIGIPTGFEALTVQLDPERAGDGTVQRGDHVTVFGTFRGVSAPHSQTGQMDVTATLVADVKVLKITKPNAEQPTDGVMVTLALTPRDATKVVFAKENGFVWLGLLPPGQTGTQQPPFDTAQVGK
ncbi:MAG: Flp pilus assembly protein CpaB [Actinomycetota bacterium]